MSRSSLGSISNDRSNDPFTSSSRVASRDLQAATASYTLNTYPGLSNETFESYLCGNLSALSPSTLNILAQDNVPLTDLWTLPDCFYNSASVSTTIQATNIILLSGNDDNDPLLRLANAVPLLRTLSLSKSVAAGPSPTNWSDFFTRQTNLLYLWLSSVTLGPGTQLFDTLPPRFKAGIILRDCGLTGAIPASFFSQTSLPESLFTFDVSQNSLTGPLPGDFFKASVYNIVTDLTVSVASNMIESPFTTSFLPPSLPNANSLRLNFSNNGFDGELQSILPTTIFNQNMMRTVSLDFSGNRFTGSIPDGWARSAYGADTYIFLFAARNNQLTGSIPPDFLSGLEFKGSVNSMTFDVAGNQLSGDIPSKFLDLHTASPTDFFCETCMVDFSRNALNGTIPSDLFANLNWTRTFRASFNFSSNQLTGDIPANLLNSFPTSYLGALYADFSFNPQMTGLVPSSFLSSITNVPTTSFAYGTVSLVSFMNTSLTGALELPNNVGRPQPLSLTLLASNADFRSLSYASDSSNYLYKLDVSNNRRLRGSIAPNFLDSHASFRSFRADNTLLSGSMPDLRSAGLFDTLSLVGTSIDFCANKSRAVWSAAYLTSCALDITNAINCRDKYPSVCTFSGPACLESTRPSLDFVCVNGGWVFVGNLNSTVITIPSGSTTTTVLGNVSSSEVVFNGVGSELVIQGCASNLSHVTIILTADELKNLTSQMLQKLISIDPLANCSDLGNVQVQVNVKGGSCKKVKSKSSFANGSLSTILSLDQSGCRTWWIILVAVIASVVVVAVIVFVLLVIFVRPVREFVRPYSKRQRTEGLE